MAVLINLLHIKEGGTVYECVCYDTADAATPKTVSGGTAWEIKNNNVVCYLGLVPSSAAGKTGYDTPLKLKKSGTEYIVQTKVSSYVTVTIVQSDNQHIIVTCNGEAHVSTFQALVGSTYTVEVRPSAGYVAGKPSVSSGTLTGDITITASPASRGEFTFTIIQSDNQTIAVTCKGTTYTSTFAASYGDTWTATITPAAGYTAGKLSATSGTITGATSISATAATLNALTLSFGATTNQTYVATINGVAKAATASATRYTVNYGTKYSVKYTANSATAAYTYTASEAVAESTVTTSVSIPAKSAKATLRYYTLTVPATTKQRYTLKLTTDSKYGGTLPNYTSTATDAAQSNLSCPYGTTYNITYTANTGYSAGADKSGTVTAATTVSHNVASLKYVTFTIGKTTNQFYKLSLATGSLYGGTLPTYTSTYTTAAQNLSVPYGSVYSIAYVANSGTAQYVYTASPSVSGTIYATTNIPEKTATATVRKYTLVLKSLNNGYWQVNGTNTAAGTYVYDYGTSLKVESFANKGYVKPTNLTVE